MASADGFGITVDDLDEKVNKVRAHPCRPGEGGQGGRALLGFLFPRRKRRQRTALSADPVVQAPLEGPRAATLRLDGEPVDRGSAPRRAAPFCIEEML